MASEPVREAVGVFQDEPSLRAAVDKLLISGFDRSEISILAGRRAVERKFGAMYDDVAELEDAAEAPFTAYLDCDSLTEAKAAVAGGFVYVGGVGAAGAAFASGGTLGAAVGGAAIAGGVAALIGGVVSMLLHQHHAKYVNQQLARGGLLLWVHTANRDRETRACQIFKRQVARDVHVHDVGHAGPDFVGRVSRDMSFTNKIES